MRFIVQEQRYEEPLAAGLFQYEKDGVKTGAVESWRLSKATEGYEFLRVDLDARQSESGHSYLFHLVRAQSGRPERLAYRFWSQRFEIEGTLLFSPTAVTGTRQVNGITFEEDFDLSPGYWYWFPSAIGLGLAIDGPPGQGDAVTLQSETGSQALLALQRLALTRQVTAEKSEIMIAKKSVTVIPWRLNWAGKERFLYLDARGWPVKMERDDGLTAVEQRNISYR